MRILGPVLSRRLGLSLVIQQVPPGACTLSCLHCDVASLPNTFSAPMDCAYDPEDLVEAVDRKIRHAERSGCRVDALAVRPEGESTLDLSLHQTLRGLRRLDRRVALFTNGSLMDRPPVRLAAAAADWVCLRVEATRQETWMALGRPHGSLHLSSVVKGALAFAKEFPGTLVTETTLVDGVNDDPGQIAELARLLKHLKPFRAYLSFPRYGARSSSVLAPPPERMVGAFLTLRDAVEGVRLLLPGDAGPEPALGPGQSRLMDLLGRRPYTESVLRQALAPTGIEWTLVEKLVEAGALTRATFRGQHYLFRWPSAVGAGAPAVTSARG
jgi:wyosine [tRNA(Phe)-imidazoG37] synthetase (radical SAM superfamily)